MSDFDLAPLMQTLAVFRPQGRTALLPVLHVAQQQYGYLPEAVAAEIGRALDVPLAEVYGVIDFYSMLTTKPAGKTVIHACCDPACALQGGDALLDGLCRRLGVEPGEVSSDGTFRVERSPCLGLCDHAPALLVGETPLGKADPGSIEDLLQGLGNPPRTFVGGSLRLLTANCGNGHPTSLADYLAGGGYGGLKKALTLDPEAVVAEVKASGLVGRGGAAFPTGLKWESAAQALGEPKFVVCNADESEPGTFKDRVLLEDDPHRTLEGLAITAYAIGAHQGYIYIRGEYPLAYEALGQAIAEARQSGYLGEDILSTGFTFDIELRQGAGAYLCGEETALFESIEGKRGYPRIKPPFPTTNGLFGKPTIINNVETLCSVPLILDKGAAAFRQIGTQKSSGSKLFCVSGDVSRPGLYEVPFGITLRELLFEHAGGMRAGSELGAVLFGGAAGAFTTSKNLDVRLSIEDLRAAGLPLGSGAVTVFNDSRDLRDVLERLARFFADESCGKCYPCQIGTQRQLEILERVSAGETLPGDVQRLTDVGWTMSDASLCGLGQTAAAAVISAMQLWPEIFTAKEGLHG